MKPSCDVGVKVSSNNGPNQECSRDFQSSVQDIVFITRDKEVLASWFLGKDPMQGDNHAATSSILGSLKGYRQKGLWFSNISRFKPEGSNVAYLSLLLGHCFMPTFIIALA